MEDKIDKSLQEDRAKLFKVKQSNAEKIDQVKTKLRKCKIPFDGFVADIHSSLKHLSLTQIITNSENVISIFADLSKTLLNEVKHLELMISTPR